MQKFAPFESLGTVYLRAACQYDQIRVPTPEITGYRQSQVRTPVHYKVLCLLGHSLPAPLFDDPLDSAHLELTTGDVT